MCETAAQAGWRYESVRIQLSTRKPDPLNMPNRKRNSLAFNSCDSTGLLMSQASLFNRSLASNVTVSYFNAVTPLCCGGSTKQGSRYSGATG